jgi:hypothetical protein
MADEKKEKTVIEVRIKFDKSKNENEAQVFSWLEKIPHKNRNYVIRQFIYKFLPVKDLVVNKLIDQSE